MISLIFVVQSTAIVSALILLLVSLTAYLK